MEIDGLKRRSFVVRYLTLFGGEGFSKVCAFGAFAYLARTLGPRDFGIVELSLSITVFFVLGAESGLGSYGARSIERAPSVARTLVPQVALLRALLSIPAYIGILLMSERLGRPGVGLLAIYGVLVLATPFSVQWLFQGLRQMQWVAMASAFRYGTFALLVVILVRPGIDTRLVAIAELGGMFAMAAFNVFIVVYVLKLRLIWKGALGGAIDLFRRAWFLGASDLAWAAMWYSPSVITGWLASARIYEVAWMAAAVRIVMAVHTFVFLYFFNMIPNLAKEIHEGLDGWRDLMTRSMSTSMWAACFIALFGTLFAPIIVGTTYGARYEAAVLPFQVAIWMIPVAWFSGHFRFSLIASGHQRLEFASSAAGGLSTVVGAYVGFKLAGTPGAAAALVLGGVVSAVLSTLASNRVIGPASAAGAIQPVIATAAAASVGAIGALTFDNAAGAVAAMLLFIVYAARQWSFARLKHAWEGRLE